MSLTVQTNIASLIAQNNLNVNDNFMQQTIERLSSGYRINSSADDAAGLVIANQYRSSVTELTQGVANANDGISTLQIVDGGLNNISTMLDRMKTLATQSASGTFSGNRATLDQEYQQLVGEINRQAANVGLNAGGTNNVTINVYIGGGGSSQVNSQIAVDLSGSGNRVDATGLGLNGTSLVAAGSAFGSVDLNAGGNILASTDNSGVNSQTLTFNTPGGGQFTATITANTSAGISVANAVQQLNTVLASHGLSASVDSTTGFLLISGSNGFTATAAATTITGGATGNALNAITAINSAIAALGNVQGTVGAGQNKLNYAIGLANSQITSFSAAESRIRDADMAAEAANLTKAQILQQSSIAAMAQANAAPQAVLALLK